jgi:hypothetical protein
MKIRLYIDEDSMSRALVSGLRARNIAVTTALEAEMIEQPDTVQLDYATAQGWVLFSFNVGDFYQLHTLYLSEGKSHAGIILSPQQTVPVGEQLRRLLKLIATKSAEEMRNTVEFLGQWG